MWKQLRCMTLPPNIWRSARSNLSSVVARLTSAANKKIRPVWFLNANYTYFLAGWVVNSIHHESWWHVPPQFRNSWIINFPYNIRVWFCWNKCLKFKGYPDISSSYGETGDFTFSRKVVFGLKMGLTPKNHPKWHFPPWLFGQRALFSLNNFFRSWPEHG